MQNLKNINSATTFIWKCRLYDDEWKCIWFYLIFKSPCPHQYPNSISQEICTRFLLCCALLWLYIDWFSHIHRAYFTGTGATLMNMDKYFMWIHYERLHNHNKAKHNKTVCIFLGIYCTSLKDQHSRIHQQCSHGLWPLHRDWNLHIHRRLKHKVISVKFLIFDLHHVTTRSYDTTQWDRNLFKTYCVYGTRSIKMGPGQETIIFMKGIHTLVWWHLYDEMKLSKDCGNTFSIVH